MPEFLYRHFNKDGILLYIGISLSAIQRLAQHEATSPWFEQISDVKIESYPDRESALDAERRAIENETPLYNIRHIESSIRATKSPENIRTSNEIKGKILVRLEKDKDRALRKKAARKGLSPGLYMRGLAYADLERTEGEDQEMRG